MPAKTFLYEQHRWTEIEDPHQWPTEGEEPYHQAAEELGYTACGTRGLPCYLSFDLSNTTFHMLAYYGAKQATYRYLVFMIVANVHYHIYVKDLPDFLQLLADLAPIVSLAETQYSFLLKQKDRERANREYRDLG